MNRLIFTQRRKWQLYQHFLMQSASQNPEACNSSAADMSTSVPFPTLRQQPNRKSWTRSSPNACHQEEVLFICALFILVYFISGRDEGRRSRLCPDSGGLELCAMRACFLARKCAAACQKLRFAFHCFTF